MNNLNSILQWIKRNYFKEAMVMKMILGLVALCLLQARAHTIAQTITLNRSNSSIEYVFREVRKQTKFNILCPADLLSNTAPVTVNTKALPLTAFLDLILLPRQLRYTIKEQNIIITRDDKILDDPSSKTQIQITGVVMDQAGGPVSDVNIVSQEKSVISDSKGYFAISAKIGETLTLSHVSYNTKTVSISQSKNNVIVLSLKNSDIEDIVVIGYGDQKRREITGAINTVQGKDLNKGSVRDPILALQGKVPGLNITKDGSPYGGASIILRGVSTLRTGVAQEPLLVVDGLPNGVMPPIDDVASIDILKDASAAAIYGSRGANGVIIVTTKKGSEGKQIVSLSSILGIERISNKIDMLSADEYRKYIIDNNLSISPDDDHGVSTDWQDEITQIGSSVRNNLSISGGSKSSNYFSSVEHYKNQGIIIGTSYERLNLNGKLRQSVLDDRLKLDFNITGSTDNSDRLIDQNQVLWNALVFQPTRGIYNSLGEFAERDVAPLNPVALIKQHRNHVKNKTLLGNFSAQMNILNGLDYVLNTSIRSSQSHTGIYYGKKSMLKQGSNGEAIRSSYGSNSKLLESYFKYKQDFQKHDTEYLMGYSWQEDKTGDGFQSSNTNFITDEVGYNNLGLGSGSDGYKSDYGSTSVNTLRLISFYGRINYDYDNKYLLQATFRRDGSSAFGRNNKWGTFPSVSAGWLISEEPFIKDQFRINLLKFRVGYGESGNSLGFDPLISVIRYGASGSFYNEGEYIKGITPTQNENPDLKWERTQTTNFGIDFSAFNNRLSGTVEYYKKNTKDLIWSYTVPATQYYVNTLLANVGQIQNKGWEFTLTAIPFARDVFQWSSTANAAFNRNKVTSLTNEIFKLDYSDYYGVGKHGQSGNLAFRLQEGYPVGQFATWIYRGADADGVSQFYDKDGGLTTTPSSLDKQVTAENAQPKVVFGWTNNLSYKQWGIDFLLRGVAGNHILNATRADLNYPSQILRFNVSKEALSESPTNTRANYTSSRYIESGSYIRLDNISLSYSPRISARYIGLLKFYLTVNNAFVWTRYKGIDPEISMAGIAPGIDDSNFYPKTRSFILGLNVNLK
ncbi:SusC/RagA family TonB-linked outer membrane protein [Sphingobacterium sp. xlx-130]|uniref:SusC/RagA family TonB-linked outer membrane protein n=1 Tax=Sphingobacterium sp. xlx-130 TaxID=2654323 RepID=UPI0013DAEDC7|nr:SusC/RagA family TonB-linked outer membrane protein [Sphingobacterium sp. xlx-130]